MNKLVRYWVYRAFARAGRSRASLLGVLDALFRRAAIRCDELPELLPHWASKEHEIDFVAGTDSFIEVNTGKTDRIRGVTIEALLRGDG